MKGGIRVLTPADHEDLAGVIPRQDHRAIFDLLLFSGMRYVELQRFHLHREWFMPERRAIFLPREASRKVLRTQPERYVHLNPAGVAAAEAFVEVVEKVPGAKVWSLDMKRWARFAGMDPAGMSVKTTRKTWESWLAAAGYDLSLVALSQGHDSITQLRHYLNLPFTEEDLVGIQRCTARWGLVGR